MSGREAILGRIRRNRPAGDFPLPEVPDFAPLVGPDLVAEFGERLKRISSEARQELEKLLDAKVFLEVWVKVRSGWADDEARVKSFGYE